MKHPYPENNSINLSSQSSGSAFPEEKFSSSSSQTLYTDSNPSMEMGLRNSAGADTSLGSVEFAESDKFFGPACSSKSDQSFVPAGYSSGGLTGPNCSYRITHFLKIMLLILIPVCFFGTAGLCSWLSGKQQYETLQSLISHTVQSDVSDPQNWMESLKQIQDNQKETAGDQQDSLFQIAGEASDVPENTQGTVYGKNQNLQGDSYTSKSSDPAAGSGSPDLLKSYGYTIAHFARPLFMRLLIPVMLFAFTADLLIWVIFRRFEQKQRNRISDLESLLEKGLHDMLPDALFQANEDPFSFLESQTYKTVSELNLQTRQARLSKEQYASSLEDIVHQLKTPLTSLSLMIQQEKDILSQSSYDKLMRRIHHLESLIHQLLLSARLHNGVLPFAFKPVDVYSLLEVSAESLEEEAARHQVNIKIPWKPDVSFTGDFAWSTEAVLCILSNCIHHSPAGSSIQCSYTANPLFVTITIQDQGRGLSQRDLDLLFDRYYTGNPYHTSSSGIGLSLAKKLLEAQQGSLQARNHKEGGCVFMIRMRNAAKSAVDFIPNGKEPSLDPLKNMNRTINKQSTRV